MGALVAGLNLPLLTRVPPFPLPGNSQALYDDKRFLWSEPLMVTTAAKSGPRAKQK